MNWQTRADLEFYRLEGETAPTWVVKDPLSLACYRLGEEEHFLLTHLNSAADQTELISLFNLRFAPRKLTSLELQGLLLDWQTKQLLLCDPLQALRFQRQAGIPIALSAPQPRLTWGNLLVLRFRGWNPQWWLQKLTPWLSWFYSWSFLLVSLALGLTAVGIVGTQWDRMLNEMQTLPFLFGPEHWMLVLICLSLTKILHELGHAVTCHHYGGRCTEMGVMLLAMVPCLYCNVSDAWTFPRRFQRVAVSAAGLWVDLMTAACCFILWSLSQPGLWHSIALLIAIFCSLNSLLLNGNPLMRYDGYYILGDLLGIANFRSESQRQARRLFWRGLMGERRDASREAFSPGMATYGVASTLYLGLVLVLILSSFYYLLKPWGLEPLAVALGMVMVPAQFQSVCRQFTREGHKEYLQRGKPTHRLILRGGLLVVLLLTILLVPFPRRVPAVGILRPQSLQPLVALDAGHLEWSAESGILIQSGQPLLRLTNLELEQEITELHTQQQALQKLQESIERKRTQYTDTAELLSVLQEKQNALQERATRLEQRRQGLQQSALQSGLFFATLKQNTLSAGNSTEVEPALSFANQSSLGKENAGRWLEQGEYLGGVAAAGAYEVLISLSEEWAEKIEQDADALVFLPEQGGEPVRGILRQVSSTTERKEVHEQHETAQLMLNRYYEQHPHLSAEGHVIGIVQLSAESARHWNYYQVCRVRVQVANASLLQRARDFMVRTWRWNG